MRYKLAVGVIIMLLTLGLVSGLLRKTTLENSLPSPTPVIQVPPAVPTLKPEITNNKKPSCSRFEKVDYPYIEPMAVGDECTFKLGTQGEQIVVKYTGTEIQIYDASKTNVLQVIKNRTGIFTLQDDVNFDGYVDLMTVDANGVVLGNIISTYWEYNKKTRVFEEDSVLDRISNPVFSNKKREIITSSRCCAGRSWIRETYSYLNRVWTLTYRLSHDYDINDSNYATEVVEKLINGKITEVSRKRVKNEF